MQERALLRLVIFYQDKTYPFTSVEIDEFSA